MLRSPSYSRFLVRGRKQLNELEREVEYVPPSLTDALDFREIFPRVAPVEIDLGCGDGAFLVALAAQNPARNFLGVERLLGRMRVASRKVRRQNLSNVRLLRLEAGYVVMKLLPAKSIAVFHLLFPDPWPKRRHHRRRLVTAEFLAAIYQALAPGGLFHLVTDHSEYLRAIELLISTPNLFQRQKIVNEFPPTAFEEKFRRQKLTIYRLLLRKVSPVKKARASHA